MCCHWQMTLCQLTFLLSIGHKTSAIADTNSMTPFSKHLIMPMMYPSHHGQPLIQRLENASTTGSLRLGPLLYMHTADPIQP
jgi:hypothetical protein